MDNFLISNSDVYKLYLPKGPLAGFVSIPHTGEIIPEEFKPYLSMKMSDLNQDVDYRVHHLLDFKKLLESGVGLLIAHVHRTCLDLNRPAEKACLNWKQNTHGTQIVIKEPSNDEILRLTKHYHTPYFAQLDKIINEYSSHERPLPVIDFHSMPSTPTAHHLKQNPTQSTTRADTCISDFNGRSCQFNYINFVVDFLQNEKVGAKINDPYYGGFLTQYMSPLTCNNIQIEVNRKIYMDEDKKSLIPEKVERLKPIFTNLVIETSKVF